MSKKEVKKVVLAYSGGLDTSIILKWLQDVYNAEVITFTADLGQGEEVEPARAKALAMGIKPENIDITAMKLAGKSGVWSLWWGKQNMECSKPSACLPGKMWQLMIGL